MPGLSTGRSEESDYQHKKKGTGTLIEKAKVIVTGDLNSDDYVKSDIPIENLIPEEGQGVPEKFRINYLHDPKDETQKAIKYYK